MNLKSFLKIVKMITKNVRTPMEFIKTDGDSLAFFDNRCSLTMEGCLPLELKSNHPSMIPLKSLDFLEKLTRNDKESMYWIKDGKKLIYNNFESKLEIDHVPIDPDYPSIDSDGMELIGTTYKIRDTITRGLSCAAKTDTCLQGFKGVNIGFINNKFRVESIDGNRAYRAQEEACLSRDIMVCIPTFLAEILIYIDSICKMESCWYINDLQKPTSLMVEFRVCLTFIRLHITLEDIEFTDIDEYIPEDMDDYPETVFTDPKSLLAAIKTLAEISPAKRGRIVDGAIRIYIDDNEIFKKVPMSHSGIEPLFNLSYLVEYVELSIKEKSISFCQESATSPAYFRSNDDICIIMPLNLAD